MKFICFDIIKSSSVRSFSELRTPNTYHATFLHSWVAIVRFGILMAVDVRFCRMRFRTTLINCDQLCNRKFRPYLTEVLGYHGCGPWSVRLSRCRCLVVTRPLLMTHPTRAIAPIILQDYLQIRRSRTSAFQWFPFLLESSDCLQHCF